MASNKPAAPHRAALAGMIIGIAALTFSNQQEILGFGGFVVASGLLALVLGGYSRMKSKRGSTAIILGLMVLYYNLGLAELVIDAVDTRVLGLQLANYLLIILIVAAGIWIWPGRISKAERERREKRDEAEEARDRQKKKEKVLEQAEDDRKKQVKKAQKEHEDWVEEREWDDREQARFVEKEAEKKRKEAERAARRAEKEAEERLEDE